MRYGLYHILTKPLIELHHPLLMTRWAEVSPFTEKRPEKLMAAIFAFDPGKTAMQIPTVQIPVDHIQRIGTHSRTCLHKVRLNRTKIIACAWIPRSINIGAGFRGFHSIVSDNIPIVHMKNLGKLPTVFFLDSDLVERFLRLIRPHILAI